MNTRTYSDIWICTNCYFAHHYGAHFHCEVCNVENCEHDGAAWYAGDIDTPADCEPLARLDRSETSDNTCSNHYYGQTCETDDETSEYVKPCEQCGSSDDETGITEFSMSSCDGCGSHLGGSRYRLAVWEVAP